MQYCCLNNQRAGTCYFEFQKGKFHNKFWLDSSIYLSAEIFDQLHLYPLFNNIAPDFNYYGVTRIDSEKWNQMMLSADKFDINVITALREIDVWAQECFTAEDAFSVLGI